MLGLETMAVCFCTFYEYIVLLYNEDSDTLCAGRKELNIGTQKSERRRQASPKERWYLGMYPDGRI